MEKIDIVYSYILFLQYIIYWIQYTDIYVLLYIFRIGCLDSIAESVPSAHLLKSGKQKNYSNNERKNVKLVFGK